MNKAPCQHEVEREMCMSSAYSPLMTDSVIPTKTPADIALAMKKDGTKYGTDYERYCISGVVKLNDLAEHPHPIPGYHLGPDYAREMKSVEQRLREEKWNPTFKRNRLTARITSSTWMIIRRQDTVQLDDGRHYPTLVIPKDTVVNVERGAALLAVLRSGTVSDAKWCIVDFLLCDVSYHESSLASSKHVAVCSILQAAADGLPIPYQEVLTPHQNKAVRLSSEIEALLKPLKPLLTIASFFQVPIGVWEDARKTWCNEEIGNYFNHMLSQWTEILLDLDPRVTAAIDTSTILALQSRAPAISRNDRSFLSKRFKQRLLFPGLGNQALRAAVESAVYRQGPILTVHTFARDIKIIRARILQPLKEALGPKLSGQNRTVRSKLLQCFKDHYIENVPTAIGVCAERDRYAHRCFERLFLQLMQSATRTLSMSEADVRSVARQEFSKINRNSCTVSPTSREGGVEISVENRHGRKLFERVKEVDWLSSDVIRDPDPACGEVTDYFMVKYIASLFLFGTPPPRNASLSPTELIAESLSTVANAASRLPFESSNSPSTQSLSTWSSVSKDSDDTCSDSRCAWSESTQYIHGDPRRGPRYVTVGDFISQRGSITGWHSSAASTKLYEKSQKRDATSSESSILVSEQKRPRLTRSVVLGRDASPSLNERPSVTGLEDYQMPSRTSYASVTTPNRVSYAERYSPSSHAYSTPPSSIDSRECYEDASFSPSDYDRSWSPITQRSTTALPNISFLDSYRNLVHLPFGQGSVDGGDHRSITADTDKQNASRTPAPLLSATVLTGQDESIQHTAGLRKARHEAIIFKLSSNNDMVYRTTRTRKSLQGFIKSQLMIDASSTFSYMIDGKTVDALTEACLLENLAIIDAVIVHSEQGHFASSQHPSIVQF